MQKGIMMNKRQKNILELIERQCTCAYQELAEEHKVSVMTIRRDIEGMAKKGLLIKTLGGAQKVNTSPFLNETMLNSRISLNAAEKRAIAGKAMELLPGNSTLFLDGSTTCWEFAKMLASHGKDLTIVTNSVLILTELGRNKSNNIVGLGGDFDSDSLSFIGPSCEDAAGRHFVDIAFFSTKGFIPSEGTFESAVNFRIKQIVAKQSRKVALLVDHTKFGQRALRKVLDISQIHVVVTDDLT